MTSSFNASILRDACKFKTATMENRQNPVSMRQFYAMHVSDEFAPDADGGFCFNASILRDACKYPNPFMEHIITMFQCVNSTRCM